MAQAEQSDPELPDRVMIGLQRENDVQRWVDIKEEIATKRDCDPDDVAKVDVIRALMTQYEFRRLENDKRIQDAREHVADDHNVDPEDISLANLLKITCSAYNGWELADDWFDDTDA